MEVVIPHGCLHGSMFRQVEDEESSVSQSVLQELEDKLQDK